MLLGRGQQNKINPTPFQLKQKCTEKATHQTNGLGREGRNILSFAKPEQA